MTKPTGSSLFTGSTVFSREAPRAVRIGLASLWLWCLLGPWLLIGVTIAVWGPLSGDPVWEMLSPKEQARIVRLLIERVAYDGENGKLSLTFRPTGLRTVCDEMAAKEAAA